MKKINYKEGIKFECQSSGNCCVSRGSYGFVYLSLKDINCSEDLREEKDTLLGNAFQKAEYVFNNYGFKFLFI